LPDVLRYGISGSKEEGNKMIELETRLFAGIETVHAAPAGKINQPLPTVIFYHGFTSSKIVYSYFAVALALAGFRVVMPDAAEHGSRFYGDAQGRLMRFWQILHQNMTEFAALHDAVVADKLVLDQQVGVAGASMGGMTALGVMTHHPDVKCVASLMGSGYFTTLSRTLFPPSFTMTPDLQRQLDAVIAPLAEWEVTNQLAQLADRPLLLWHGEDDDVVPAQESFRLQRELAARQLDKQLTWLWEPGVKHRITPTAVDATVTFFKQHLA